MSDEIPLDIQIEIIKNLPIKSLVRFRSVSQQWKSLIGSSEFNVDYTRHHAQRRYLFITYREILCRKRKYVSIMDDDTFPEQNSLLTVPQSLNLVVDLEVVGSSHGLLCLQAYFLNEGESRYNFKVVVWNPSLRKTVSIDMPCFSNETYLSFGVCPKTSDPKIVKIDETTWQIEVFTLSSGVWRTPLSNPPSERFYVNGFINSPVVKDRFIYFCARKKFDLEEGVQMIISFNLTNEEFKNVCLPDNLASQDDFLIFKLRESLALIECNIQGGKEVHKVWMMDHGVSNSFTELYTFDLPFDQSIEGFRTNDQLIMEIDADDDDDNADDADVERVALITYEPSSKRITNLGFYGESGTFIMSSYTESLLLLNQPNTTIGGHNARYGD